MFGKRTTAAQMQQLMKKIQAIQLDCMGKMDGFNFDINLMTRENGFTGEYSDSLTVSISPYTDESHFYFYNFWTTKENQEVLNRLRAYIKKRLAAENKDKEVFK